jgi:hypothetical protein
MVSILRLLCSICLRKVELRRRLGIGIKDLLVGVVRGAGRGRVDRLLRHSLLHREALVLVDTRYRLSHRHLNLYWRSVLVWLAHRRSLGVCGAIEVVVSGLVLFGDVGIIAAALDFP